MCLLRITVNGVGPTLHQSAEHISPLLLLPHGKSNQKHNVYVHANGAVLCRKQHTHPYPYLPVCMWSRVCVPSNNNNCSTPLRRPEQSFISILLKRDGESYRTESIEAKESRESVRGKFFTFNCIMARNDPTEPSCAEGARAERKSWGGKEGS